MNSTAPSSAQAKTACAELSRLELEDRRLGNAESALAYARGAWRAGQYTAALERFEFAFDSDPDHPNAALALVRAAAMLGRGDVEARVLAQRAPQADSAWLALHRALRQVPANIAKAQQILTPHLMDADCAQFDLALSAVLAQDASMLPMRSHPSERARDDSLRWALANTRSIGAHAGLPVDPLLRAIAERPEQGMVIECGVYFGRSLGLIAERCSGEVHGFDSFQGLPESWNANEAAGAYSTSGQRPAVAPNVTLHAGWFEDTLPAFVARLDEPLGLLHVDCDLYSSTRTVLSALQPSMVAGTLIVFDDLLGYPGFEAHELRAWNEFVTEHDVRWEPVAIALLSRECAVRILGIRN